MFSLFSGDNWSWARKIQICQYYTASSAAEQPCLRNSRNALETLPKSRSRLSTEYRSMNLTSWLIPTELTGSITSARTRSSICALLTRLAFDRSSSLTCKFLFQEFDKTRAFLFLGDIKQDFNATYGLQIATAISYGMNTEFSRVLKQKMHHFSTSMDIDAITRIHGQIDELKDIMVKNIGKFLISDLKITETHCF